MLWYVLVVVRGQLVVASKSLIARIVGLDGSGHD